ncbi:MAG: right-handed parallel beta-helix repeat-containing protein [Cyanobacteria bacterium P01_F01_bin.56]
MLEAFINNIDITNLPQEILAANPGLVNAVANDEQNDADAIQAAIDWLTAQREAGFTDQSTIYIPVGVFDLAKTLQVNTPDITFEGAGAGLTVLQNADTFQIGTQGLPDSGVGLDSVNRDAYLFNLDNDADDVTFTNLTLTGPEVHGAIFGSRTDGLEISQSEFNDFTWSSVRLFNASDVAIYDNLFIDAGGQAEEPNRVVGGSIYATFLKDSVIYNNQISKSGEQEGNVFGIKGRQFRNTRIYQNTIDTNFAIELPFENDQFVEIDHNFLGGAVSIPKSGGGSIPEDGYTFHIHHNYFTQSYSLEFARNGTEIDHNVFVFDTEEDNGNLISSFGLEPAPGPTKFHNNLILNPGRGVFWSRGVYDNFSFHNNEVIVNDTVNARMEGLFGFNSDTDFSTIEIKDNIIEVNGSARPLMRNEASYQATIENNTLSNVADADEFANPNTGVQRGLIEPLLFQVGANNEFTVDGFNLQPTADISDPTPPTIGEDDAAGSDTLVGDNGDNLIDGLAGDDIYTGGGGADQFVLRLTEGVDSITDFEIGVDQILLGGLTPEDVKLFELGDNTLIMTQSNQLLGIVEGVTGLDNTVFG